MTIKRIACVLPLLALALLASVSTAEEPAALKVHLIGVGEYEPHKSLPKLQKYLEKTYRVECSASLGGNGKKLDNLDALKSADVLVIFARRMNLPDEQMKVIRSHWEK